ncbi:MAG: hypothetical protein ACFFCE_11905 [Promethearchaeota archaeon]
MRLLPEFFQIYVLYIDRVKGVIPILIFSNKFTQKNKMQIFLIKFHPIRFLDPENETDSEQINLIYNGEVYYAKRVKLKIKDKNFEKAYIILILKKELSIYGTDLLNIITDIIKKNFSYSLNNYLKSEILKEDLIKSSRREEIIKEGKIVKENIKKQLRKICEKYFESVIYSLEKIY